MIIIYSKLLNAYIVKYNKCMLAVKESRTEALKAGLARLIFKKR